MGRLASCAACPRGSFEGLSIGGAAPSWWWMVTCRACVPHIPFAVFYPDGVVHDPVHDGVGVDAASESLVPVLLGVLGGEQGAAGVVAAFHELEQKGAEAFLGQVEQPFVEREGRVAAVSSEQFGSALGFVGGLRPFFLEVRDADAAGAVPVAACLAGKRADDPAFPAAAVALGDDVAVAFDPCAIDEAHAMFIDKRIGSLARRARLRYPRAGLRI